MKCMICGKDNLQFEYKRGKGKADIKKAVIGGVLTAGMGGIGAAAGLTDLIAQKCYMRCPDCGYNQFGDFSAKNVMDPEQMTMLEVFYDDFGIPYRAIRDQLADESKKTGIPARVRLAEFQTHAVSGPAFVPCILIENPSHSNDYCSFCIAPGNDGFFVWLAGESKQLNKKDYNKNQSATHGAGWATAAAGMIRGGDWGIGTAIGGVGFEIGHGTVVGARKLFNSLTINQQALDQEMHWYEQVRELTDSVLGL